LICFAFESRLRCPDSGKARFGAASSGVLLTPVSMRAHRSPTGRC